MSTPGRPRVLVWCHSPTEPRHRSWDTAASRIPTGAGPWRTRQSWGLLSSPTFWGAPHPRVKTPALVTSSVPASPIPSPAGGAGSRTGDTPGFYSRPETVSCPQPWLSAGHSRFVSGARCHQPGASFLKEDDDILVFQSNIWGPWSCLAEVTAPPAQGADTVLVPSERQTRLAMCCTPGNRDGDTSCT